MDVCGYQTGSLIYIKRIRTQLMLKNEIYSYIKKTWDIKLFDTEKKITESVEGSFHSINTNMVYFQRLSNIVSLGLLNYI